MLAVYIRDVSRDPSRASVIETLAEQVTAAGSALVLAADSHAMAVHAVDRGLVSPDVPSAVHQEQRDAGETPDHGRPRPVHAPSPSAARQHGSESDLKKALGKKALGEAADPEPAESIVVESDKASPAGAKP